MLGSAGQVGTYSYRGGKGTASAPEKASSGGAQAAGQRSQSNPTAGAGAKNNGAKRVCELCQRLGLGGEGHTREWCFVDPKSKAYKADISKRRIAQAKAKGIQIPKEIEHLGYTSDGFEV